MTKRKRNVGLGIKRKASRLNKNEVTVDNDAKESNNEVSVTQVGCSNSNIINLDECITSTNNIDDKCFYADDDPAVVKQDFDLERKLHYQTKLEAYRWTIFHLFTIKHRGMTPPEDIELYSYWLGRKGVGAKIKRDLNLPRTCSVKNRLLPIFEKIVECIRTGEKFHPSMVETRGGNRKITLQLDSIEAQIIADSIESGLSLRRTWHNVNRHRQDNGDELVSESCVSYILRKMRPKIVRIKKRKQGSTDVNSNWAQARYAWTRQLLARFGRLERTPSIGPVEAKFDQHIQGKLDLNQIVWWDETHRKCLIGSIQNPTKTYDILFPRNLEGKFDQKTGQYSKERKTKLNVKYEKECRLGLGVAMVQPLSQDGVPMPSIGRRCQPFDYTSKVMIGIPDYNRLMKVEFQRIKSLKGTNGYWYESSRDPLILYYQSDPTKMLKGVGKKSAEMLESIGIKTVGDLKAIQSPTDIKEMPSRLSITKLTKFMSEAKKAVDQDAPIGTDHRISSNPYESKFGAEWEKQLKTSVTFSHSSCICDYIDHMMAESEQVMKGTIHEKTWVVYHDALAIMTSQATKEWMAEKGYLKRWILPSDDLYNNLPVAVRKSYQGKPIGNSPEYMPLDTHLNQDIHASHDYHVTVTSHAAETDLRKFSGSTPKRLSYSYIRLTDPTTGVVPTTNRIMQDVKRVLQSLERVREAKGCIIDENVRRGRQYERNDDEDVVSRNWGGNRRKQTQESYKAHLDQSISSIHNDAMLIMAENSYRDVAFIAGRSDDDESSLQTESRNLEDIVLTVDNLAQNE